MTKIKRLFALSLLIGVLFLSVNAFASSDIGYTINRGTFSLTVRFGFDDKFENGEPNKLDQTFMTLTQWVWDNKTQLAHSEIHYEVIAQTVDKDQLFIIYNVDEDTEKIKKFKFFKGQLARNIIQEISNDMNIKTKYSKNHTHLILVSTKENDLPEILSDGYRKEVSLGSFSVGAIPGGCHNSAKKINGIQYNCAFLFWADDPAVKIFSGNDQVRKDVVPLTRKAVKKFLGEIH